MAEQAPSFYQHQTSRQSYLPAFHQLGRFYYKLDELELALPLVLSSCLLSSSVFLVNAKLAQYWLKTKGLQLARPWPNKALMILSGFSHNGVSSGVISFCVYKKPAKYRVPILGFCLALLRQQLAVYTHYMPTSDLSAAKLGACIWGLPQWQSPVELKQAGASLMFASGSDGKGQEAIFSQSTAIGGDWAFDLELCHQSYSAGFIYQAQFNCFAKQLKLSLGGEKPKLGNHPLAHWLYNLGLPKKPLFSLSCTDLSVTLPAPEVLAV